MKQQRNIIIFLIVAFIASSLWLFTVSNNILDKDEGKNWWAVYFINPESNNLSFTIENHSDNNNFHWEVVSDKIKTKENDVSIKKGSTLSIDPEINPDTAKRVTILVTSQKEKREIYKNF